MRSLLKARALAATAVAAGAALLAASVGGMRSVDRELQAATTPAPIVQSDRVAYETGTAQDRGDCPERRTQHRDQAWREF
jgi:hypothetical protein